MSTTGRRAELIRILRGRRRDTVLNLAHELGVSERTIRRDLLTLTVDEGYHIDTLQGNGGGVFFHDHRKPYKGILSQEQANVLAELMENADTHQAEVIKGMLEAFV